MAIFVRKPKSTSLPNPKENNVTPPEFLQNEQDSVIILKGRQLLHLEGPITLLKPGSDYHTISQMRSQIPPQKEELEYSVCIQSSLFVCELVYMLEQSYC